MEEDPATVSSMIWHGFPVVRYLLLWLALWLLYFSGLRWLDRQTPKRPSPGDRADTGYYTHCISDRLGRTRHPA